MGGYTQIHALVYKGPSQSIPQMPPKHKRSRSRLGGLRQRRKKAKVEEQTQIMGHSVLASFLLQLFAWGEMSAQRVQKLASLAMTDIEACMNGTEHLQDLRNMAKIGTHGHHQNKCYADLMRQCLDISIPRPFVATIPFVKPLNDQFQSLLLPHELFSAIYHSYKGAWRQSIYGSADSKNLIPRWLATQFLSSRTGLLWQYLYQCTEMMSP